MIGDKGEVPVEVALTYNTSYSENVYSYVNNINTYEGGNTRVWFPKSINKNIERTTLTKTDFYRKVKVEISGDDFREGLTAVISVKVQLNHNLGGKLKSKLGNIEAARCCR